MKASEHERQDWVVILIILVIGFLCVIAAGGMALRFSPGWQLNTNMDSHLEPISAFLTRGPGEFVEALDPSILTQPSWIDVFLTPGASFVTGTPFPNVSRTASPMPTTVSSLTATAVAATSPTSTLIYFPPTPSSTPKPNPTNTNGPMATSTVTHAVASTSTPTNTAPPVADLQVTKNDGASTYPPGGTLTYTVTIINNGPSAVTGAVVADNIPAQIVSWDWACDSQNAGASGCDAMNSSTNFSDIVDLPYGASIVYTVTANTSSGASGDLINTASVSLPAGFTDPAPGTNLATDIDQILISDPFPSGNIGTTNDGSTTAISPGDSLTLTFDTPIDVGGHAGYDLVYYELPAGSGILMDHVILQLSDGYNWYTILNWGDNIADRNTNVDITSIGGTEDDNRDIASAILYNATGVAIELDGVIPDGTYPYIRISAPIGDPGNDGCDVDAIEILP